MVMMPAKVKTGEAGRGEKNTEYLSHEQCESV